MKTVFYREQKYICGDYLDVHIYPVFLSQRGGRSKKKNPTSQAQAKLNEINASLKLTRLLHNNFTSGDMALYLTYTQDHLPADEAQAKRNVQNYLRRIKRIYQKNNIELKYVWITERAKSTGRIHHHMILNGGVDRTELEMMWKLGYADSMSLQFTKDGLAGLANYIIKDKQRESYKRWCASKNLKRPQPINNDYKISRKKAANLVMQAAKEDREEFEKMYPEYIFNDAMPFFSDVNGGYYLFVRMYKKTAKIL